MSFLELLGKIKLYSRYLRCAQMFCCRLFSGSRRTGFRFSFPTLSLRAFSMMPRGIGYIVVKLRRSLTEMIRWTGQLGGTGWWGKCGESSRGKAAVHGGRQWTTILVLVSGQIIIPWLQIFLSLGVELIPKAASVSLNNCGGTESWSLQDE